MTIIDIHTHDGAFEHTAPHKYDYCGETMADFIADLARDGVSHCLMSSVQALVREMISGNAETFADASLDPRLFAYTYYDPSRPVESILEIEKYQGHPKFIGLKSRPEHHRLLVDDAAYRPMIEAAVHLNKPILLHTWPIADAHAMAKVASASSVRLIMVHACGEQYVEAATLIKPYENVFVEPVTSAHLPGKIRALLDILGHERIMFGSDYGLLNRVRVLKTYEEARLSSTEHEAIFNGNARRIFGLE